MLLFIRFLLICVSINLKTTTADDQYEYLDLDISNPDSNFYKIESTNYDKILLNDNLRSERKCVGRVLDGDVEVLGVPDPKFTYRKVKLVKVPKQGSYNPDLEELDLQDSVAASQTVDSDYENVVEVHTFTGHNVMMERFKKNSSNQYERFEYELVDVDLCQDMGNTVQVGEKKYLKVDNFKTVGTIKCKGKVLLDSLNVFYRTLEFKGSNFVVKTLPRFGLVNEVKYNLHESRDHVTLERNYRVQMSLKLDNPSSNYSRLMANCGSDCLFYDGCNEKHTLVDVYDENQYLYKNPNTYCLTVKSEEVRGVKYLTVFDLHRNSNSFLVKMFKHDGRGYVDHTKKTFDMDFTNFTEPKPVDKYSYQHFVRTEKVGSNLVTRVLDVEFRMGKIYYNGDLMLGEGENVFNREVYSSEDGLLVHDEYYNGESRRYLFRPEEDDNNNNGNGNANTNGNSNQNVNPNGSGNENGSNGLSEGGPTSGDSGDNEANQEEQPPAKVVKKLKLDYEDGVKVDLYDINTHVTAHFTDSNNNLFVKPSSFVEKLGTLSYKGYLAYPYKFFVDRQYMILGENHAHVHAVTWKGFSFFESLVKVPTLKRDDELFVCKAKDLVHFDVQLFYEALLNKKLNKFNMFDINNLGDYYLVGVTYRRLYSSLVGNVSFGLNVFAPLDMDLVSRFLLLPKNTQSFVVIMDCDFTDCLTKFYKQTSSLGHIGYEIQEKEAKELDLIKVFENDRDPSKLYFVFDAFKVYKHGKVYYVRVNDDLSHKIGKVLYKGKVLFEDDKGVFNRMVNVSRTQDSSGNQSGSLRLLDVQRWEKSGKHFTYEIQGDDFKLTEKEKVDFELDLEPSARKNILLNISERNEVLSYYLNWNNRDDYSLSKVIYSEYDKNDKKFKPNTVKDGLEDYPVFVRLHKHDDQNHNEFVVVVENHGEHDKPKNGEFFKLTKNAAKHGLLLKYNVSNKKAEVLADFNKDLYHRRNFTSHRHHFTTSSDVPATSEDTEV